MLKKIGMILVFLVLSVCSFGLKIDSVDFDEKIKVGESVTKEFTLLNSNDTHIQYMLEVEGKPKNIKVEPSNIVIPPFESKKFKITVVGDKIGENSYFLVLRENKLNIDEKVTQVKVKMNYRIEQKYIVE